MKLENNYIFLSKTDKKTDPIIKYIKDNFDIKEIDTSKYKNLDRFSYKHKLKEIEISIVFELITMPDKTLLKIKADNKYKVKCVAALEEIEQQLLSIQKLQDAYIVIISNSATSEYYCNKIYPKLNEFERKLRQLMFNIYIYQFGKEYLKITTDQQLENTIKKNTKTNNKNTQRKEIDRIQNAFYEFTYYDFIYMLFREHWCQLDEDAKNKFLNNNPDLSQLTDKQLREFIASIQPKSDWDRFFKKNILSDTDISSLIKSVQNLRNSVAHCKLFFKDDYKNCLTITNRLIKNIDKAIRITEEKDFVEISGVYLFQNTIRNIEAMYASFNRLSELVGQRTLTFFENSQRLGEAMTKGISPAIENAQRAGDFIARILNRYASIVDNLPAMESAQRIGDFMARMQNIYGSVVDDSPIIDISADSDENVDDDERDD